MGTVHWCSCVWGCLGFLWANMSTLPAPSCGRIVKPLYFLSLSFFLNRSPGWLLETCFCFPKGGAKAPVCAGLHFCEHCNRWTCSCHWEHGSKHMGLVAVWWEVCRFITQGLGRPWSWWERALGGELPEACVLQIIQLKSWSSQEGWCPFTALSDAFLLPSLLPSYMREAANTSLDLCWLPSDGVFCLCCY